MINIITKVQKVPVSIKTLKSYINKMLNALGYKNYSVSVLLTTNKTIKKYNNKYRNKNTPTDILSFYYKDYKYNIKLAGLRPAGLIKSVLGPDNVITLQENKYLGDIIISLEYTKKTAHKFNRTYKQHLIALLAHGLVHLVGYTHNTDQEYTQMQKIENKLLKSVFKKSQEQK
jgi:probable rRNA maturation factor